MYATEFRQVGWMGVKLGMFGFRIRLTREVACDCQGSGAPTRSELEEAVAR